MMKNSGKIAFVTGASSGIGLAVAEAMAKEGYTVYGTSRHANYDTVSVGGAAYTLLPMTLEDEDSVAAAVRYVADRHGRIDVLVNAAGSGVAGAVEETTAAEARAQFDVCFFGVLSVLGRVLPLMRAAGGGKVINIGSMASFFPLPFQGMYCGAKAALLMATFALRMEIGPFGVRVCQIDPGDVKTGFTARRVFTAQSKNTAYRGLFARALYEMIRSEQEAKGPEKCARLVLKIARMKRPPVRRFVGFGNKTLYALAKFAPGWAMNQMIRMMYLRRDPPVSGPWTAMMEEGKPWKNG